MLSDYCTFIIMGLQSEPSRTGVKQIQVPGINPWVCDFPQTPGPFWNKFREGPEHSCELTEAQKGKWACPELMGKSQPGLPPRKLGVKV